LLNTVVPAVSLNQPINEYPVRVGFTGKVIPEPNCPFIELGAVGAPE
jgi:hypothetical protein